MLQNYVPKSITSAVSKAFKSEEQYTKPVLKSAKKTWKDAVEKEAKKENQEQTEGEASLTNQEHERALNGGACKSFVMPR